MGVWVMNLIDNRAEDRNTPEKFRQCRSLGVLAIGWAKEDPLTFYKDGDLKAYKTARRGLSGIEMDDFVWVRDTVNKEYYICKVCGPLETAPSNLWPKDIGEYRKAEWYGPVPQNELPDPITVQRLVSRPTIRRVLKPDVIKATASFTLDVYGHVTDQMKRDSAARMEKFIHSVSQ